MEEFMSVAAASLSLDSILAQSGVQLGAAERALITGSSPRDQIHLAITLLVRASLDQGISVSKACGLLRERENALNGIVPGAPPEFPVSKEVQDKRDFKKIDTGLPDNVMSIMGDLFFGDEPVEEAKPVAEDLGAAEPAQKKLRTGEPNTSTAVPQPVEAPAAEGIPAAAAAAAAAVQAVASIKRKIDEI